MSALKQPVESLALEEFLERLRPRLRSLFARYCIPLQDTEDILQQALLAMIHQGGQVRNSEGWLLGTLRKRCLLYWRERRRRLYEAVDSAVLEWLARPVPPAQEQGDLRHDLDAVLAHLPSRCRQLLRLRYQLGLETRELAERTGYRSTSISKITTRCLAALARELAAGEPWSPQGGGGKGQAQVRTPRKR